jgi:hypothetical protein
VVVDEVQTHVCNLSARHFVCPDLIGRNAVAKRLVGMRALVIVLAMTKVAAAEPPPSPPPIPAHPWSWTPLVSELYCGSSDMLVGAEVRMRHSTEANFEASTISLGVQGRSHHSAEPYVMFGADSLHYISPNPNRRSQGLTFADLHVGIGGGYGFVLGRVTAGLIFAPTNSGHYTEGNRQMDRFRLTSQADLVLEVKAGNGELRVALGLEFDPLRFIPDALRMW